MGKNSDVNSLCTNKYALSGFQANFPHTFAIRVIRVWFQNKRCKDKKKNILMKQMQEQHQKVSYFFRHCLFALPLFSPRPPLPPPSLSPCRVIRVWFQNKRFKEKMKRILLKAGSDVDEQQQGSVSRSQSTRTHSEYSSIID